MPASSGFTVAHASCPFGGVGSLMLTSRNGASGPDSRPGALDPTVRAPIYRGALLKYSSASVVTAASTRGRACDRSVPVASRQPLPECVPDRVDIRPHLGTQFHYLDIGHQR